MAKALFSYVGQPFPDPHRPRFPPPPLLSPALENKRQNKISALSMLESARKANCNSKKHNKILNAKACSKKEKSYKITKEKICSFMSTNENCDIPDLVQAFPGENGSLKSE